MDKVQCQCCSCENEFYEKDLVDGDCPVCSSGNWVYGYIDEPEPPEDNFTDVEADADTLRSAGYGTDEDYGYFEE